MFFEKQHQKSLKVKIFKSLSNQPPKGLSFFQKGLSLLPKRVILFTQKGYPFYSKGLSLLPKRKEGVK
jgi:hypothetical protein